MAIGAFLVAISDYSLLTALGGLGFGLGFATMTTMAVTKLDNQK